MDSFNIGKIIRDGLYHKNMKQTELAKLLHVEKTAVNRWCNNKTVPDANTLLNIAKILDISLDAYVHLDKEAKNVRDQRFIDAWTKIKKEIDKMISGMKD